MKNYKSLSKEIENEIKKDRKLGLIPSFSASDEDAIRRTQNSHDNATVWRTNYIRDIDKIIYSIKNKNMDKNKIYNKLRWIYTKKQIDELLDGKEIADVWEKKEKMVKKTWNKSKKQYNMNVLRDNENVDEKL